MTLRRLLGGSSRPAAIQAFVPWLLFVVLVVIVASRNSSLVSVPQLKFFLAGALALVLVATGQMIVILSGGIDLSVAGIISLATVVAATHMGSSVSAVLAWVIVLSLGGAVAGLINGVLITGLRMQPFLVTLATWAVWEGAALLVLPTTGGSVPQPWLNFGNGSWLGLTTPLWIVLALVIFWIIFVRTRLGTAIKAMGSHAGASRLAGIPTARSLIAAYVLSGVFSALAALFLLTQTASGSPVIGDDFILPSIAAVVIGGAKLTGGRAGIAGTIAGALVLSFINTVTFAFGIPGAWSIAIGGILLIASVVLTKIVTDVAGSRGLRA